MIADIHIDNIKRKSFNLIYLKCNKKSLTIIITDDKIIKYDIKSVIVHLGTMTEIMYTSNIICEIFNNI